jgi:hypothetical protein
MIQQDQKSAGAAGSRGFLSVGLGMMLAVGFAANEGGHAIPSMPIDGLQPAAACTVSLPWFGHSDGMWIAPLGNIALNNDGGWCSLQFIQAFKQLEIAPAISVVAPAAHGEVRAQQLDGRLSVAYRPAPGFVGTDHFAVLTDGPYPHTIPIDVTVR